MTDELYFLLNVNDGQDVIHDPFRLTESCNTEGGGSPMTYNFKLKAEAVWLIVNTVLGAVLIEVAGYVGGLTALPAWDDFRAWAIALGLSAIRTLLGAILAAVTSGGFNGGPAPEGPAAG